ncbi:uncharacterized protein BDW47DRAFT_107469 [Aspergillus candidus]|uniref:Uncharacterized protein n=1 Tax=Aspergillus candidus TaxID=41067 RepID=A0A2I2F953_ASPCN|nr:hypothetical protein BDW47DRAFT_107469 [Aspergillus candidus]PLB37149.1 hypothetical protein BDW47DRAFT_107469 [Aspergillus candidus]
MTPRTIYLVSDRQASSQRAHFSLFVPSTADPTRGTIIQVIGAPMTGYALEFKRNHSPSSIQHSYETCPIGQVASAHIVDSTHTAASTDCEPKGDIEIAAAQVPPPRISENFLAPVNDTTNKRCQEWTMEYIRHLVRKGLVDASAVEIVQSKRDPPGHGIGLQPAGRH